MYVKSSFNQLFSPNWEVLLLWLKLNTFFVKYFSDILPNQCAVGLQKEIAERSQQIKVTGIVVKQNLATMVRTAVLQDEVGTNFLFCVTSFLTQGPPNGGVSNGGGSRSGLVSAAPQQSEICVKFSVFHTVFDVKFW